MTISFNDHITQNADNCSWFLSFFSFLVVFFWVCLVLLICIFMHWQLQGLAIGRSRPPGELRGSKENGLEIASVAEFENENRNKISHENKIESRCDVGDLDYDSASSVGYGFDWASVGGSRVLVCCGFVNEEDERSLFPHHSS